MTRGSRAADRPYARERGGLRIAVRLTPRAGLDAVDGIEHREDRVLLAARVRAAPEKGKANAALERLLARWLGVPPSRVSVVTGGASRIKALHVAGDAEVLADGLRTRLAGRGNG